jgi:hypothetical protein
MTYSIRNQNRILRLALAALVFDAAEIAQSADFPGVSTTTITFGEATHDIGNQGPIVESGFRYDAVGDSWSLVNQSAYGADGNALVTFWGSPVAAGNVITFRQVDGSPFWFRSLELSGRSRIDENDRVMARGFLDGQEVATQLLQSDQAEWRISLASPGFQAPIDSLKLEVVQTQRAALMVDNLVFESVPEPGSLALLVIGLLGLAHPRARYSLQALQPLNYSSN